MRNFIGDKLRECAHCRQIFMPVGRLDRWCSVACKEAMTVLKAKSGIKRLNVVPQKHRGAWAELVAVAWLLERGYEVFRNVSSCGPVDIVALKGGETVLIDVKFLSVEMLTSKAKAGQARSIPKLLKPEQAKIGVELLYVGPDGFASFSRENVEEIYTAIFTEHLTRIRQNG